MAVNAPSPPLSGPMSFSPDILMNYLLRPRIWPSFPASSGVDPCDVPFRYASEPTPCGCPVARPSSWPRDSNSWNIRARSLFRHPIEQVIMQKLGHNSSILFCLKPSTLFLCFLLPLAINRYDLHSRIEVIPTKMVVFRIENRSTRVTLMN